MGKLRRIHISEITDRQEKRSIQLAPDFLSDTLNAYIPVETRKVLVKFKDEYRTSYAGLFNPGHEPTMGESADLEYAGILSTLLCMNNVEDDRGFRFVYRKLN